MTRIQRNSRIKIMEETAKKEKKQDEIKEEKDKQPAGKEKEKKEEQELVRERKTPVFEFRLSHSAGQTLTHTHTPQ